jgi:hypothetical protein
VRGEGRGEMRRLFSLLIGRATVIPGTGSLLLVRLL